MLIGLIPHYLHVPTLFGRHGWLVGVAWNVVCPKFLSPEKLEWNSLKSHGCLNAYRLCGLMVEGNFLHTVVE